MKYLHIVVPTSELQLGDTIRPHYAEEGYLPHYAFDWHAVVKVTDKDVTLFRPFAHTGDIITTNGIGRYVGIEEYTLSRTSAMEWFIYSRCEPGDLR